MVPLPAGGTPGAPPLVDQPRGGAGTKPPLPPDNEFIERQRRTVEITLCNMTPVGKQKRRLNR
ncbi:MAG TPA: hypothetical protein PLW86_20325 [Rhodocyclaceae bacterium]|nr:hypothetical protein [Rhodocyclaceae bacterium]